MPAPVKTSPKYHMDWLKHETDPQMGRREIVLAAAAGALDTGTPIGKVTATGKHKAWSPTAEDGSEDIVGLLLNYTDAAGASDVKGVVVVADALVADVELTWPSGITSPQKTAALADLAAKNINPVRLY